MACYGLGMDTTFHLADERIARMKALASKQYACGEIKDVPDTWDEMKNHPRLAFWLHWYAQRVMRGRWPEAEPVIVAGPAEGACWYAQYVIKGRWPVAEQAIAAEPGSGYWYARYVIKGRWPVAEPAILADQRYGPLYRVLFMQNK